MPDVAAPKRETHRETLMRLGSAFKRAKTERERNEILQEIRREEAIFEARQAKLGGKRVPQRATPRSKRIPDSAKRKTPVQVLVPGGARQLPPAPVGEAGSALTGLPSPPAPAGISLSTVPAAPAVARAGGAAPQPSGSGTSGLAGTIGDQPISEDRIAQLRSLLEGAKDERRPRTMLERLLKSAKVITAGELRSLLPAHVQQLGQRFGTFDRMLDLMKFQRNIEADAVAGERTAILDESVLAGRAQTLRAGERKEVADVRSSQERAVLDNVRKFTPVELFEFGLKDQQGRVEALQGMEPSRAAAFGEISGSFGNILNNFANVLSLTGKASGLTRPSDRALAISSAPLLERRIEELEGLGDIGSLRVAERMKLVLDPLKKVAEGTMTLADLANAIGLTGGAVRQPVQQSTLLGGTNR